jgi:hypothetical protein
MAASPQDLPVFESGNDVCDTCSDAVVRSELLIVDDPASVVGSQGGNRRPA